MWRRIHQALILAPQGPPMFDRGTPRGRDGTISPSSTRLKKVGSEKWALSC